MGETKDGPNFEYQSVSATPEQQLSEDAAMRPQIELGNHPQLAKKRGWIGTFIWQFLAFLWLVPVVALLYLNWTEHVIGASAWCPAGNCWLEMFNPNTAIPRNKAKQFDKDSHDLLGGLQFVAKALEVWFGIIAASLVYLLTMRAAGKKEGLPVGYLTRPLEFADPITLLDPLLWKTGPSPLGVKSAAEKRVGRRVWFLVALSVGLCILINLMGPATAVLVIPALNLIPTPKVGDRVFQQMNAADPPSTSPDSWLWWDLQATTLCNAENITNNKYACTLTPLGDAMDAWLSTFVATGGISGITTESVLTFAANTTAQVKTDNAYNFVNNQLGGGPQQIKDLVWWTPSRQIISNLASDWGYLNWLSWGYSKPDVEYEMSVYFDTDPYQTYVEYNKSLELTLMRNGPVLGAIPTMWVDYNSTNHWTVEVDANRQVRCYNEYDLAYAALAPSTWHGKYTRCIRTGSGWSSENKRAGFCTDQVYNSETDKFDPGVNITVYTSDKVAFFPQGERPDWIPAACLSGAPVLNSTICPWERIFTTDPSSDFYNRTLNAVTVEFYMANGTAGTHFVVDFNPYYDFTTYSLNVNPLNNPARLVQTADLPTTAPSIAIDPNWYLAAWSVDEAGALYSNRTSTLMLQNTMLHQLQNPYDYWTTNLNYDYLALIPTLQTLSLIDHTTSVPGKGEQTKDAAHPVMQRWAQMYVWSYAIGSRTSDLGIAVAIMGCLIVLWQVVLGFTDRRRYRSPTQLVVAALEHAPRGEFEGKGHNEVEMARVRFHIRDNDSQAGKFSFYEPEEKEPITPPHLERR